MARRSDHHHEHRFFGEVLPNPNPWRPLPNNYNGLGFWNTPQQLQPHPAQPGMPHPQNRVRTMFSAYPRRAPLPDALSESAFVDYAFKHPDSQASHLLGLENNSLTDVDKSKIKNIINASAAQTNFFDRIIDFFVGLFQGPEAKAERIAMRTAGHVYENLKNNGYSELASKISGVAPDGHGDYQKLVSSDGKPMGMYAFELHPQDLMYSMAVDKGQVESPQQGELMKKMYDQEIAKLYSDPAVRQQIAIDHEYFKQHPGRDNAEAAKFIADNRDFIKNLAQSMADDPDIKAAGKFDFSTHLSLVEKQLEIALLHEHPALSEKYHATTPDPSPEMSALVAPQNAYPVKNIAANEPTPPSSSPSAVPEQNQGRLT